MTVEYTSPIGKLYITSDDGFLTRIEFFYTEETISPYTDEAALKETVRWLDCYFSGGVPDFTPRFKLSGSEFSEAVLSECTRIGYGDTRTYGDIAVSVAKKLKRKPCARAVGDALNKNPIPIIIPCHRVIGKNGAMVGFAPGIDVKIRLLKLEGCLK